MADTEAFRVRNPANRETHSAFAVFFVFLFFFCGPNPNLDTAGVALNRVPSPESNKDNPRPSYRTC